MQHLQPHQYAFFNAHIVWNEEGMTCTWPCIGFRARDSIQFSRTYRPFCLRGTSALCDVHLEEKKCSAGAIRLLSVTVKVYHCLLYLLETRQTKHASLLRFTVASCYRHWTRSSENTVTDCIIIILPEISIIMILLKTSQVGLDQQSATLTAKERKMSVGDRIWYDDFIVIALRDWYRYILHSRELPLMSRGQVRLSSCPIICGQIAWRSRSVNRSVVTEHSMVDCIRWAINLHEKERRVREEGDNSSYTEKEYLKIYL